MPRVVSLFLPAWSTDRLRRILGAAAPPAEAPLVLIGREGRRRVVLAWTRKVHSPFRIRSQRLGSQTKLVQKVPVWWLRLGIEIERIKPGNPQQNGRHERMHLTLKLETTKPAGNNFLQQQAKFDDFIDCYNNERPHQALNMRYPAERYVPSTRPYKGLPDLDYPFHDKTVTVTTCGRICFNRQKINLSVVFAGQKVGVKQVSDRIWLVTFMDYDLGYFDDEQCRLEPLDLRTKSVTDVSGINRNLCVRNGPEVYGWGTWIRTMINGVRWGIRPVGLPFVGGKGAALQVDGRSVF